jgi:hypothetical protein
MNLLDREIADLTIKDMKIFLKDLNMSSCFSKKENYISRVKLLQDYYRFPWREDQKKVLDEFLGTNFKYYVINGIFGCGKTTLLIGMLLNSILRGMYKPEEIMFLSFNVCIRNEIKVKLRLYGFRNKIKVRTFDSLIYEMCKMYNYKYLNLPNFDGKRRFIYNLIENGSVDKLLEYQPKVIFIDEVQDLGKKCFAVFKTFYPNTRIIFAGDIFQSIQKEPRESLLWDLLETDEQVSKMYMTETPRVPHSTLGMIKETLTEYYPEFSNDISKWKSSNSFISEKKVAVKWETFNSYIDIFKYSDLYVKKYGVKNTMILTFSSAITVKGAMGDVSRLRTDLLSKGYDINTNYKQMDENKLFLSTVNSSKGLERDYVIIFSTFPLEKAFVNFSEDLTMNLITVGLTRAKKKVVFFAPAYKDKFSSVLNFFKDCPKPQKDKIRSGKILKEYQWADYISMEHNVTEMLRQSILIYDTRIKIKESVKMYDSTKLFEKNIFTPPISECEEHKAFVGLLIENLITTTWTLKWPTVTDLKVIENNPMYSHCISKIRNAFDKYNAYIRAHDNIVMTDNSSNRTQFDGVYLYVQLHIGIFNKLFMSISGKDEFYLYWCKIKSLIMSIKPTGDCKIKIQHNVQMPLLTGVCDVFICSKEMSEIWELKASKDYEWKDDALTQACLYALMCGRTRYRIHLLNPFRNEKCSFYFNSKKIMTLRNLVYKDIIAWNFNCYLSKNNQGKRKPFPIKDILFEYNTPFQYVLMEFLSPTKIFIKDNFFYNNSLKSPSRVINKLCKESEVIERKKERTRGVWTLENIQEVTNVIEMPQKTVSSNPTQEVKSGSERSYDIDTNEGIIKLFMGFVSLLKEYKFV